MAGPGAHTAAAAAIIILHTMPMEIRVPRIELETFSVLG